MRFFWAIWRRMLIWYPLSAAFTRNCPACGILLITETRRPGDLRRAVAAGAVGYPVDGIGPTELIEALRRAARGALTADDRLVPEAAGSIESCPLTERELDVLRLAAEGASSAEIASRLCLSSRTVRNHVSRIIGKVGARNRIDAIRIAADARWI
jgi:two-component system, NarL family, response regulator DesR